MIENNHKKIVPEFSWAEVKFSLGGIFNPKRDWIILITFFVIFFIASLIFDGYFYNKIVSGDMYVSVSRDDLTVEELKSDDLKKVLNNFEEKKAKITNLKLEKVIDPSI